MKLSLNRPCVKSTAMTGWKPNSLQDKEPMSKTFRMLDQIRKEKSAEKEAVASPSDAQPVSLQSSGSHVFSAWSFWSAIAVLSIALMAMFYVSTVRSRQWVTLMEKQKMQITLKAAEYEGQIVALNQSLEQVKGQLNGEMEDL